MKKINKSIKIIEEGFSGEQLSKIEESGITGGYFNCGGQGCGGDVCGGYLCGGDGCLFNACGGNACGGNICGMQLCPVDLCPIDACIVDFFYTPFDEVGPYSYLCRDFTFRP